MVGDEQRSTREAGSEHSRWRQPGLINLCMTLIRIRPLQLVIMFLVHVPSASFFGECEISEINARINFLKNLDFRNKYWAATSMLFY